MEERVNDSIGAKQLEKMAHMSLSIKRETDGKDDNGTKDEDQLKAQANDVSRHGTLLRRSPRFDDDDIERIYEDLGIAEIPPRRTNSNVEEQDTSSDQQNSRRSMTPFLSRSIHAVRSQAPQGPKEHEGYTQPRQTLIDHAMFDDEEPRSSDIGHNTFEAPLMIAEIINDLTSNDRLETIIRCGDQYDVFGASQGFVGIEDVRARKRIWIPGWCCNVWPKKLDSEKPAGMC